MANPLKGSIVIMLIMLIVFCPYYASSWIYPEHRDIAVVAASRV